MATAAAIGRPATAASQLGVWAAEGIENDRPNSDISELHKSDFLEGAKGARTPEITTFCGVDLLPPRLLAEHWGPLTQGKL
jgi:hypothetical protein